MLADAARLERALAELPPLTRSVLWLYHVEEYTHQEIAEMTGKSVSFSKSQVARGAAPAPPAGYARGGSAMSGRDRLDDPPSNEAALADALRALPRIGAAAGSLARDRELRRCAPTPSRTGATRFRSRSPPRSRLPCCCRDDSHAMSQAPRTTPLVSAHRSRNALQRRRASAADELTRCTRARARSNAGSPPSRHVLRRTAAI